ncbi:MAG: hypothetical protein J6M66_13845 [Lachnospiraceae bacterium]|nr:hypothetical protein [Lachnospiraceae bacterium]
MDKNIINEIAMNTIRTNSKGFNIDSNLQELTYLSGYIDGVSDLTNELIKEISAQEVDNEN